jgi:hypothetical protein
MASYDEPTNRPGANKTRRFHGQIGWLGSLSK